MPIEERRFYPGSGSVRLVTRSDGKTLIRGYAAVFFQADDPGTQYELYSDLYERIMPGAFDRALREKQDVRCLFNHDPNYVLGRCSAGTMRLSVDSRGLVYETVPGDTSIARDVCAHLERGDVDGSSFSFNVLKQTFVRGTGSYDVREIHDVELYDAGPVTFPAYTSATSELAGKSKDRSWFLPEPGAAPSFQWSRARIMARAAEVESQLRPPSSAPISRKAARKRAKQIKKQMKEAYGL